MNEREASQAIDTYNATHGLVAPYKVPLYINGGPHSATGCCTRCGKPIDDPVWLEFDMRINEYHDFGDVPESANQGEFPFGADCAEKLRARARAKVPV